MPQLALAWLLAIPGISAPIVGPRNLDQLEDVHDATEIQLDEEERRRLEAPAPRPEISPQRMLRWQLGLSEIPSLRRHPVLA